MFDLTEDLEGKFVIVKRFHGEDTVFSVMEAKEASEWPADVYYPLLHLGAFTSKTAAEKARDAHVITRRQNHKAKWGWEGNFYPIPKAR